MKSNEINENNTNNQNEIESVDDRNVVRNSEMSDGEVLNCDCGENVDKSELCEKKKTENKTNWVKELREWVLAVGAAVLVALLVRNFVFTLVNVKGASMEPSLHENDRLYVNRFMYKPEKGDVVIFRPSTDPNRPYVKRVIATEGDTVYIDFNKGNVYVNDELIDEPYIKEKTHTSGDYINKLIRDDNYSKDNPIVIQPGYAWCMGDNRNNSLDSRHLGPIPEDELIGGAVFRFWPLDRFGGVHDDAEKVSFVIDDTFVG